MTTYASDEVLRQSQLTGILELICQQLELTETQRQSAENRYMAIGRWLAEDNSPALKTATIYPQGSVALQTTVRPWQQQEFDLDLVCHVMGASALTSPTALKQLVGDRLKANATYEQLLEEKPRCWRIIYADEFHLDITPSIRNPECPNGGELVPDKKLRQWKASNPRGYRQWFDELAALRPMVRLEAVDMAKVRAEVEALPGPSRFKGVLRRGVQLSKRHRDVYFSETPELAPISIILTTLAARSYAACVGSRTYETDLDLLRDVISGMPSQIEIRGEGRRRQYFVWNETTNGENFAEKWNSDARLAEAFYRWHSRALADLVGLESHTGLDSVRKHFGTALGEPLVAKAMSVLTERVGHARKAGRLAVATGTGLTVGGTRAGSTVRTNTFYGS